MAARILPSQDHINECLDYNPTSGSLVWRIRPVEHFKRNHDFRSWNTRFSGKCAYAEKISGGGKPYWAVTLDGTRYPAHRVIWKMATGADPVDEIDHINGDGQDNRWDNLREASGSQNRQNARRLKERLHPKGVTCPGGSRFYAEIRANGERRRLGSFATAEDAHAAYAEAAQALHGPFSNAEGQG